MVSTLCPYVAAQAGEGVCDALLFIFCRLWKLGPQHSAWASVLCILCLVRGSSQSGFSQSAGKRTQCSPDQPGEMGPQARPSPGIVDNLSWQCFHFFSKGDFAGGDVLD